MNKREVAVVTGASRGIGRAIAVELASEGYDIVGISRTLESSGEVKGLDALRPQIETLRVSYLPLQADISDLQQHPKLVSEIMRKFGRIDLLVNNAGVAPEKRMDALETTPESFHRVMSVNLAGAFFLTQTVAKEMIDLKEKLTGYNPKIIFITSISAEVSSINRAEYCISKAGLSMAARIFADRLAGLGINVYEIRPGIIKTDMTKPVKEKYN